MMECLPITVRLSLSPQHHEKNRKVKFNAGYLSASGVGFIYWKKIEKLWSQGCTCNSQSEMKGAGADFHMHAARK